MININKIIKENIYKFLKKEIIAEENNPNIQKVDNSTMKDMMDYMDANLEEQERPKVGIFWYSPRIKDVFGVVAVDAQERAEIEKNRTMVSCKELHKYVWKKKFNYYKYHGGSDLYVGDYKNTPRGRVFYCPKSNEFIIMVGTWFNDNTEALDKIKNAFDLNQEGLNVKVEFGDHWEIGMGYGD